MVAKVAGGIIGIGLIGTGGVAFVKPEWLGINREIPWTPLFQDKDFTTKSSSYSSDSFGSKYKNYLTGIVGTDKSSNDSWWEESLTNLKEDKKKPATKNVLGNGFKDEITIAVKPATNANTNTKYLNEVCDTIYKVTSSNVTASPESTSTDKYKEVDVWKYCSPLGQKPTTVQAVENKVVGSGTGKYTGTVLGKTKEATLVSVEDPKNNKFWEIRDKEFKRIDGYPLIETGTTEEKFFKKGGNITIKELCKKAYEQNPETSSSSERAPTEGQAVKYCSLDKQ